MSDEPQVTTAPNGVPVENPDAKLPSNPTGPFGLPPHQPWYDRNYSNYASPGTPLRELSRRELAIEIDARYEAAGITVEKQARIAEEARPQNQYRRDPADRRRVTNRGWKVPENAPKGTFQVGRTFQTLLNTAGRALGAAGAIIYPSPLGDGTWENPEDIMIRPSANPDPMLNPGEVFVPRTDQDFPEIPAYMPREIEHRRIKDGAQITFTPLPEVDPYIPVELPIPYNPPEIDTYPGEVAPQRSPRPAPRPEVQPVYVPGTQNPTRVREDGTPAKLPGEQTEISFDFGPDGSMRIRTRQRKGLARAVRWRRDSKYNRLYKTALLYINRTYGELTELGELVDAVAWNTYAVIDGKQVPAMVIENGNYLGVTQGIFEGRYEVDPVGALIDHGLNKAFDYAYGKAAQQQHVGRNLTGYGYNSPWSNSEANFQLGGKLGL